MAPTSLERQSEGTSDSHPLLMDQLGNARFENHGRQEHIIDINRGGTPLTPHVHDQNNSGEPHQDNVPSTSAQSPNSQSASSSASVNPRIDELPTRRGDAYNRRHRGPLNSGFWLSIELIVNLSQIIAAVIVLSLSRHEKPRTPLLEWIIGYTTGCAATLPHLYWRYIHRNSQGIDQESAQILSDTNTLSETMYSSATVTQAPSSQHQDSLVADSRTTERTSAISPRLNSFVERFKMALDFFFAVWFVVGNFWIFGGQSSASTAPNLYRLCIAFLTFSFIGYAMPFILCATICCCLPCIISILSREDLIQNRGATADVISSLPVYKFTTRSLQNVSTSDGEGEGGVFAAGTDKERVVSSEDASCCICLANYGNNEDLRELPCSHFFHMECVDKWLKINALCPLCKFELGEVA